MNSNSDRGGDRMDVTLLFALLTFTLFGLTNFFMKIAGNRKGLDPLVPSVVLWLSIGVMGLLFLAYLYARGVRIEGGSLISGGLWAAVLAGVFLAAAMFAMTYAFTHGGKAGVIVAIANANTVLVSILAYAFMGETLGVKEIGGMALIITGIVIMTAL